MVGDVGDVDAQSLSEGLYHAFQWAKQNGVWQVNPIHKEEEASWVIERFFMQKVRASLCIKKHISRPRTLFCLTKTYHTYCCQIEKQNIHLPDLTWSVSLVKMLKPFVFSLF